MRGSRVINSIGLQNATVLARPLGNQRFLHKARWTHALTVGESGTLRGFRPQDHPTSQFGLMEPDVWGTTGIWQLTGGTGAPTQNWQLRFGDVSNQNIQLDGVTNIWVMLEGYGVREMVWEPANNRYNYLADAATENIYNFLGENLGKVLGVKIGVASPS